jgi:hypothetical protein
MHITPLRSMLIAWVLLLFALPALAQAPAYNLYNKSDNVLNFQTLDPGRGTWKDQQIAPREQKTYTILSGARSAKIRIGTPNQGYKEYVLAAGGLYHLSWSHRQQMWDVRTDQAGNGYSPPPQHIASNTPPGGNAAPPPPPRQMAAAPNNGYLPYQQGQPVLVFWQQRWYPATIMQHGGSKVKVHYDGYNNSWDEWVEGPRIRPR